MIVKTQDLKGEKIAETSELVKNDSAKMNHLNFEMSFSQFSEYGNEWLPTAIVMM